MGHPMSWRIVRRSCSWSNSPLTMYALCADFLAAPAVASARRASSPGWRGRRAAPDRPACASRTRSRPCPASRRRRGRGRSGASRASRDLLRRTSPDSTVVARGLEDALLEHPRRQRVVDDENRRARLRRVDGAAARRAPDARRGDEPARVEDELRVSVRVERRARCHGGPGPRAVGRGRRTTLAVPTSRSTPMAARPRAGLRRRPQTRRAAARAGVAARARSRAGGTA